MLKSKQSKAKIAELILQHPDRSEILVKLLSDVSPSDISEWLSAKYSSVAEKKFVLPIKTITTFKDDYLDMYSIMKDDLSKMSSNNLSAEQELQLEIQGSPKYHQALERYTDAEVDIKTMVKKMVSNIEFRTSQMFDHIQEDSVNFRADRVLIEWFNTLLSVLEKYDTMLNGNPDQINIQNNINIQVVDQHINVIHNIIKEILAKLDYDTSLQFIEMFNDAMQKLDSSDKQVLPQDIRIQDVQLLNEGVNLKLDR